jgi:hypothetical protein
MVSVLLEACLWLSSTHAPCPVPYTLISSEIFRSQQRIREQYLQHVLKAVPKCMWRIGKRESHEKYLQVLKIREI